MVDPLDESRWLDPRGQTTTNAYGSGLVSADSSYRDVLRLRRPRTMIETAFLLAKRLALIAILTLVAAHYLSAVLW